MAGQYYQEKGIFYGGHTTREPSVQLLERWLGEYLAKTTTSTKDEAAAATQHNENATTKTKPTTTTWIDVHTGLGPMGVDSLIVKPTSLSQPDFDVQTEMKQWFPNGKYTSLGDDKDSVSKGYEHIKGILVYYFEKNLFVNSNNDDDNNKNNDDQPLLIMTQEFGTVPTLLVAHALIVENAAYFCTSLNRPEKLAWATRTTRRAFYPQSPKWRQDVLARGLTLLYQAMARSAGVVVPPSPQVADSFDKNHNNKNHNDVDDHKDLSKQTQEQ